MNKRLAGGVAMETDTAGRSAIVVVCKLVGVDNTVAAVVILQLLLLMLEIYRLVVKIVRTGLLRLCIIKLWAVWLLDRVTVRLLWRRGLAKERVWY